MNFHRFVAAGAGDPAFQLSAGIPGYNSVALFGASYDPALRVSAGQLQSATSVIDRNAGRPPRQINWNIGLQRQVGKNLVAEAAYVGNRGVWFRADGLNDYNALTPDRIRAAGLNIGSADDRALLTSRLDSPLAVSRGFKAPYTGFPLAATVAQSLRPFPQFTGIGSTWAPLGSNWYDSLQAKLTKRYSYGLDFTMAYTWSKNLTNTEDQDGSVVPTNDVFNRRNQKALSREDQPHVFVTGFNFALPVLGFAKRNSFTRAALGGWTMGGILRYSAGKPIRVPQAQNNLAALLFRGTNVNRVAGEPLFTKDLNCHCFDPAKDFVLNPKAWADPGPGEWGTAAAYYSDYRYARRHDEQISLGKEFRIRERMSLRLRAELFNVFNRTYLNNPDSGNAKATQTIDPRTGFASAGFGRVNTGSTFAPPRSGQIVARFQF